MNRPILIGLIAEGEAELGKSIPYISPEDGGKVIDKEREGALHTLIRRELENVGLSCDFVQRHPSFKESGKRTLRTGYSILEPEYLKRVVSVWQPEEIDIILIVVDADDILTQRQKDLDLALKAIRSKHSDINGKEISDRSAGGLAIRNFDTWLLADTPTVAQILGVEIGNLEDIECLENTKEILENAIAQSTYLADNKSNQRLLQIKWNLAAQIDLTLIKTLCPRGYKTFVQSLIAAVIGKELLIKNY